MQVDSSISVIISSLRRKDCGRVNKITNKLQNINTMFLKSLLFSLWIMSIIIFTPTQADPATRVCENQPTSAINYTRELIGTTLNDINDMDVSHHTGNIYVVDSKFTMQVIYKGEQTTKQITIKESVNAIAVDKRVPKVYIGLRYGMKTYNELSTDIEDVPHINNSIFSIFLPKGSEYIYARDYDGAMYQYHKFSSKVMNLNITLPTYYGYRFVVDADDNYYYATKQDDIDVSEVVMKGNSDPVIYNDYFFLFDVDNAGRVYYTHGRKLYHMEAGGTKSQFIMAVDFYPWHLRFDKDNNIVIGSSDKRIFIYKFSYDCVSLPTKAVTNITLAMNSINTIQKNVSRGIDDIKRELNATNLENKDIFNSVITEVKSIKGSDEDFQTYTREILVLKNEIVEQNKILVENNKKMEEINNEILYLLKTVMSEVKFVKKVVVKTLADINENKNEL